MISTVHEGRNKRKDKFKFESDSNIMWLLSDSTMDKIERPDKTASVNFKTLNVDRSYTVSHLKILERKDLRYYL